MACKVPVEELLAMMTLLCKMSEVACAVLYLHSELRKGISAAFAKHNLKTEVLEAVSFAAKCMSEAFDTMEAEANMYKSAESLTVDWAFNTVSAKTWLKSAASVLDDIKSRVYHQAIVEVSSVASKVEKHTPRYEHFCNEKSFVGALAKKHLLNAGVREKLGSETIELYKVLNQVTNIEKQWSVVDSQGESAKEMMGAADVHFKAAKKCLAVIAAVNVALNMTAEEQRTEATSILEKKKSELPSVLVSYLENIKAGVPVPSANTVSRKRKAAEAAQ